MSTPKPPDGDRLLAGAIVAGAVLFVVLSLASMAALHERHYRDRRRRLLEANLAGLELRLRTVEAILREDRMT